MAGLKNPAQESWRGKPSPPKTYKPGLIRKNDEELIAGLKNPAQESWRGKPSPPKTYKPGLIRDREVV